MPMPKNQAYESTHPTAEEIRQQFCITPIDEEPEEDGFRFINVEELKKHSAALDIDPVTQEPYPFIPYPARQQLLDLHSNLCRGARETMAKKNQDYATDQDVFRNFRMFGGLGILVRASDKLARLRTFEERDTFSVTDESLRDTIEDLINYAVIYLAYKQEGKP